MKPTTRTAAQATSHSEAMRWSVGLLRHDAVEVVILAQDVGRDDDGAEKRREAQAAHAVAQADAVVPGQVVGELHSIVMETIAATSVTASDIDRAIRAAA